LASDPLEFTVVSADERTAIDKALLAASSTDPYDTGLARARVLVDHRLWFDALGAYDALITKYPNHPELYEDRATIYAQLPVTKPQSEADKAHAK
jgi:regulator of sirC expression with transglutaminase-like and TPR domain